MSLACLPADFVSLGFSPGVAQTHRLFIERVIGECSYNGRPTPLFSSRPLRQALLYQTLQSVLTGFQCRYALF